MKTKLVAFLAAATAALVAVLILSGSTAAALETYTVTNENDSGPGSLRDALALAETDDDDSLIVFADNVATIELDSQLLYDNDECSCYSITIAGDITLTESGSWSSGDVALLRFEETGDVELRYLTFTGGYDGFSVDDPVSTMYVTVAGVTSTGNESYGGWVENATGSNYTIDVQISDSSFSDNGSNGFDVYQETNASIYVDATSSMFNGSADGYGLRAYHDGTGSVYSTISDSHFDGNYDTGLFVYASNGGVYVTADGSTFDRSMDNDGLNVQSYDGSGNDLEATITNSQAIGNYDEGIYLARSSNVCCSADLVASFSGVRAAENGYDGFYLKMENNTSGGDISFYEVDAVGNGFMDGNSGVRIENFSEGSLDVTVTNSNFLSNGDEGFFVDDNSPSSLDVTTTGSVFRGNGDEGLDLEKGNSGAVYFTSNASRFVDNGDGVNDEGNSEGVEIDNVDGAIYATVTASAFDGNLDDGLNLQDDDDGCGGSSIELTATSSSFDDNGGDGVDIDECDDGDVIVRSFLSSADRNGEKGYDLDEADGGVFNVITLLGSAADNGEEGISLEGGGGLALVLLTDLLGNGNGQTEFSPGIFSFVI